MPPLEEIAYDAALRALDKQEALVAELRARSGVLLGASSIAASLLAGRGATSMLAAVEVVSLTAAPAGNIG